MPPTIGAAMGFITSEPMTLSQRIGTKLASTAVTVMSFGRNRWTARPMNQVLRKHRLAIWVTESTLAQHKLISSLNKGHAPRRHSQ